MLFKKISSLWIKKGDKNCMQREKSAVDTLFFGQFERRFALSKATVLSDNWAKYGF